MNETVNEYIRNIRETPRIENLFQQVKKRYEDTPLIAHGWDHVYRTFVNAMIICMDEEEADVEIVAPAILIHDIGFLYNDDPAIHHLVGAEHCRSWLPEWNESEQEKIEWCIRKHKGMMKGFQTEPSTLEECIVCDSDLLEKAGYIGALQGTRTFVEFGENKYPVYRSLKEIAEHLQGVDELEFFTRKGREIAKERGGMQVRKDIFKLALKEMEIY